MVPGYSLLGRYFDKYYPLVGGLCNASGSLGLMVFAPLTQILLDAYGWRNTLLVLGGLYFHLVISGMLLRSPHHQKPSVLTVEVEASHASIKHDEANGNKAGHEADDNSQYENLRQELQNLGETERFTTFLNKSGLSLFKNMSFVANTAVIGCTRCAFMGWVIYFVPHCMTKGLTPHETSLQTSIVGFAYLIGNFIYMPIISRNIVSIRTYFYCTSTIAAISLFADTFSTTFATILLSNSCFLCSIAAVQPLLDVCLKSAVGEQYLSRAFGWRMASGGIFRILAGFIVGRFLDTLTKGCLIRLLREMIVSLTECTSFNPCLTRGLLQLP